MLRFFGDLERRLCELQEELEQGTYRPGEFRSFMIYDPKPRWISAAPFRDRVVHHALCRVIEPIFERTFVSGSCANRKGKGTKDALDRAKRFAKQYRYVLKADIRKFFPSIDHQILKDLLRRKLKDPRVFNLADLIIDHSNPQEAVTEWFPGDDLFTPLERRRGLPIGNQTSQFCANAYLNPLDHFFCEQKRIGGYVRYVDDFLAFGDDKGALGRLRQDVSKFLERFRLSPHPQKRVVFPTKEGIPFLGFRVFPDHTKLAKANVRRFRRRLRKWLRILSNGDISEEFVNRRIQSWMGHARMADTWRLRKSLVRQEILWASVEPRPSGR